MDTGRNTLNEIDPIVSVSVKDPAGMIACMVNRGEALRPHRAIFECCAPGMSEALEPVNDGEHRSTTEVQR
ncbi:hypothetical protein AS032_33880 [Rhodococcus qingshengii]|nr:hypothetical protein AOT96_33265 [Rhodococcus sp. 008]KSU62018.1 hypothetical protein AS032_33880 [Rhodococcus qingshengii]SCC70369.1 hypothetical protein GA0061093_14021 [Rhodococcus qingshengii]